MFRKLIVLFLISIGLSVAVNAQFTARTKLAMRPHVAVSHRAPSHRSLSCFVTVADVSVYDRLQACGVTIRSRFGTLAVVEMPPSVLPRLEGMAGLRAVAVAQPLSLANDSARFAGNVDAVHLGTSLPQAFRGRGVVIGVIDSGVDFNHVNFLDSLGNNRIVRAYLPQDSTGAHPVIAGDTLPGSHYDTPEKIALLTTDNAEMWHGTHTLGTAAGCTSTGYHGVAPEATLVVCAMPLLYDTDIANSIRYILDYADSVGCPAVVSMSFASQEGAHNGTSPLCRLFDECSGPGRVMVISAGNSARERIYLNKRFKTAGDTLRTYFDNYSARSYFKGYASTWSATASTHRLGLTVIDRDTHRQVAEAPMFALSDSVLEIELDSIAELSPYFTGELLYASALEDNGQFHSIVEMNVTPVSDNYRLGMQIVADEPQLLRAWASGVIMINDAAVPGYTAAVRTSCINDLATGDSAISVGAWCSRLIVPTLDGGTRTINRCTPDDIAYFSSYGPDARGIARPEICAPGMALVSSCSRYYDAWPSAAGLVEEVDGIQYPYGAMSGTSMSAPFTAGSIALWMQACPWLSPTDVREVLAATSRRDSYVDAAPQRWGYGKLDVTAGMEYVLAHFSGLEGDLNRDGTVDIEDVNILINVVLNKMQDPVIRSLSDLNGDGVTDIVDLNELINLIL